MPLTEQQVRAIVQQEIQKQASSTRYQLSPITRHTHNGIDSPQVSQANIIAQARNGGNITMATDGATYKIGINFNPTQVVFNGFAYHVNGGGSIDKRAHVFGIALLGPAYYMQPGTSTSTVIGGPLQTIPPYQSMSYLMIDNSGAFGQGRAVAEENHIVDVYSSSVSPANIVARATIVNYNSKEIDVLVVLASDWTIQGNWVVT